MSARVGFQWVGLVPGQPGIAFGTTLVPCGPMPARCVAATSADWRLFNDWYARDPSFFNWRKNSSGDIYGFTLRCPKFWPSAQAGTPITSVVFDREGTCAGFATVSGAHYVKYVLWAVCRGCQTAVSPGCPLDAPLRLPNGSCFGCATNSNMVPVIGADGRPTCVCPSGTYMPATSTTLCQPIPTCPPNTFWNTTTKSCTVALRAAPVVPVDVSVYRVVNGSNVVVTRGPSTRGKVTQVQALPGMLTQGRCYLVPELTRQQCEVNVTGIPDLRVVQVLQILGLWSYQAPLRTARPTTVSPVVYGAPGSVGQVTGTVTLKQNHIYRSRTLFGYDPSKHSCDDVRDFLNKAITAGQANASWPWSTSATLRLIATLDPNSKSPVNIDQGPWPVQRIGSPFETTNFCLIYMQGQWRNADQTINAADLAKLAGPNARLLDFWDHTSDKDGSNPFVDLTGTGCGRAQSLTYDPNTGDVRCRCAAGYVADPTTGQCVTSTAQQPPPPQAPPPTAFTTIVGNVYRSRWLAQVQPQDTRLDSCDKVLNVLKLFAAQLSANTAFPYENLSVSADPPAGWPSTHIGVPYTIEDGWCTAYIEGTARSATTIDPNQSGAPGVRVLDMWDSTSGVEIKAAPQAPIQCIAGVKCIYHPLTDTFTVEQPVAVTAPPSCPTGQGALYDALRNAYVCCDVGQSIDPVTGACAAPAALPLPTVTCSSNSHPDATSPTGCVCDSGYQTDGAGNCVPVSTGPPPAVACPPNSHADASSPTGCACNSGYQTDGAGNCVPIAVGPPPATIAAAKPSNTALYVGLGALVVTALFLAGRLAS